MWAKTLKGKHVPIDNTPAPDGNITLSDGDPPTAIYHGVKARGITYYKSHFATCPDAKKFRKK